MPFKPGRAVPDANVITPDKIRITLKNVGLHESDDPKDSALFQVIDNTLIAIDTLNKRNKDLTEPVTTFIQDGNSGTIKTINFGNGPHHFVTLTGNVTFTLENPIDGQIYTIIIATGAGGFTATWPASVLWPGGTPPVITVGAGAFDKITLTWSVAMGKYLGEFYQDYQ